MLQQQPETVAPMKGIVQATDSHLPMRLGLDWVHGCVHNLNSVAMYIKHLH
jgi:hypothetical protein